MTNATAVIQYICVWKVLLLLGTMAPFLRIAFNSFDMGILPPMTGQPFCAIKMKEALTTGETTFDYIHWTTF